MGIDTMTDDLKQLESQESSRATREFQQWRRNEPRSKSMSTAELKKEHLRIKREREGEYRLAQAKLLLFTARELISPGPKSATHPTTFDLTS